MTSINALELICRSCMAQIGTTNFDLFKTPQLADLYIRLSTTHIDSEDLLPKSICQNCHKLLRDFEQFQIMCVDSYQVLLLSVPVKDDFKEEYLESQVKEEESEIQFGERVVEDERKPEDDVKSHQQIDDESCSNYDPLETNVSYSLKDEQNEEITEDIKDSCAIEQPAPDSDEELLLEVVERTNRRRKAVKKTSQNTRSKECDSKRTDNDEKTKSTKTFSCEKCTKVFYKRHKYEAHVRAHLGLKPYACKICPKGYSKKTRLLHHELHDHSENPVTYPCTFEGCEKVFSYKEGLRIHMKNIHISPRKQLDKNDRIGFICECCGKVLSSKPVLRKHTMIHTNEFPFVCDICPNKYRTQDKLNVHKLKHQGIKRYECEICGLKKTTGHELNVHMMVHTKPKIHKCEQCPSSFRIPGDLMRHVNVVHHGVKSYTCKYCDQRFGRSDTLKDHEMRHTGERRYECPICGKKFIQNTSFRMHVRRHGKTKNLGGTGEDDGD